MLTSVIGNHNVDLPVCPAMETRRPTKDARGGPRPNAGRKPLPDDVRLRHKVVVAMDDRAYDYLTMEAIAHGQTVQDVVRGLLAERMQR